MNDCYKKNRNFLINYIHNSTNFYNFIYNFYKNSIIAIFFGGSMQKETFISTKESDIDVIILYNDFTNNFENIDRLNFYYDEIKVEFIPQPLSSFMSFNTDKKIWLRKFFIGTTYINRALLSYEDFLYIKSEYKPVIDYIINNPHKEELLTNGVYYLFGTLFMEKHSGIDFTNFLHKILNREIHYCHSSFLEVHNHNRCEKYITLLLLGASKLKIIDDIDLNTLSKIKQEIVLCAEKETQIPLKLEDYIIKNLEKIYKHILTNPIDVLDVSKKINQEMSSFVYQILSKN